MTFSLVNTAMSTVLIPLLQPTNRGDPQVHSGATPDLPRPALHQPPISGVQELRKVRGRLINRNQPTLGDFFAIRYLTRLATARTQRPLVLTPRACRQHCRSFWKSFVASFSRFRIRMPLACCTRPQGISLGSELSAYCLGSLAWRLASDIRLRRPGWQAKVRSCYALLISCRSYTLCLLFVL